MTLKQYKDYFKASFDWDGAISIGKIDKNKDKAICFYNSKRTLSPIRTIDKKTYKIKTITILVRCSKNQDNAERIAMSIYDFFDDINIQIEGKNIYIQHLYSEPNNLGTDENGVYEYTLELNCLEER